MSRTPKDITVRAVRSIGRGTAALTVCGRVADGPASMISRQVNFFMADTDLAFVLSTLAQMPAYRDVFRAIADELDWRERVSLADDSSPVTRLAHKLDSPETSSRVRQIITESINAAVRAMD